MDPFRIHAYEVIPQRLQKTRVDPRGGSFRASKSIKNVLAKYLKTSKLERQPEVGFTIDDPNVSVKAHSVRSAILKYCYGSSSTANRTALELAKKLSYAMDDRSPYTLLLLSLIHI